MKKFGLIFLLIVFGYSVFAQSSATPVNFLNMFFSYLKGNEVELSDVLVEGYIRDYHGTVYTQNRNNEFQWYGVLEQYRENMAAEIDRIDLNASYSVAINANFENYDFSRNGFPVPISEGTYIRLSESSMSRLGSINLYFLNLHNFNFFEMERNQANDFLTSRTDRYHGGVNRQVRLLVFFNLEEFSSTVNDNLIMVGLNNPVVVTANRVEVYDNNRKIGDLVISD